MEEEWIDITSIVVQAVLMGIHQRNDAKKE